MPLEIRSKRDVGADLPVSICGVADVVTLEGKTITTIQRELPVSTRLRAGSLTIRHRIGSD